MRNATVVAVATATATAVTLRIRERRKKAREESARRDRLTVKLPVGLIERARNAVFWTEGLTLTGLIEESLENAIARLERRRGQPFTERSADLRAGRPRKS